MIMGFISKLILKWRLELGVEYFSLRKFFKNLIGRQHISYIFANYLALLVNFFSGVLIARELGAQ